MTLAASIRASALLLVLLVHASAVEAAPPSTPSTSGENAEGKVLPAKAVLFTPCERLQQQLAATTGIVKRERIGDDLAICRARERGDLRGLRLSLGPAVVCAGSVLIFSVHGPDNTDNTPGDLIQHDTVIDSPAMSRKLISGFAPTPGYYCVQGRYVTLTRWIDSPRYEERILDVKTGALMAVPVKRPSDEVQNAFRSATNDAFVFGEYDHTQLTTLVKVNPRTRQVQRLKIPADLVEHSVGGASWVFWAQEDSLAIPRFAVDKSTFVPRILTITTPTGYRRPTWRNAGNYRPPFLDGPGFVVLPDGDVAALWEKDGEVWLAVMSAAPNWTFVAKVARRQSSDDAWALTRVASDPQNIVHVASTAQGRDGFWFSAGDDVKRVALDVSTGKPVELPQTKTVD